MAGYPALLRGHRCRSYTMVFVHLHNMFRQSAYTSAIRTSRRWSVFIIFASSQPRGF
jgi:hypothetical protein